MYNPQVLQTIHVQRALTSRKRRRFYPTAAVVDQMAQVSSRLVQLMSLFFFKKARPICRKVSRQRNPSPTRLLNQDAPEEEVIGRLKELNTSDHPDMEPVRNIETSRGDKWRKSRK